MALEINPSNGQASTIGSTEGDTLASAITAVYEARHRATASFWGVSVGPSQFQTAYGNSALELLFKLDGLAFWQALLSIGLASVAYDASQALVNERQPTYTRIDEAGQQAVSEVEQAGHKAVGAVVAALLRPKPTPSR